jgi:hypothetical protein
MTLDEYINQKEPRRRPDVRLKRSEYTLFQFHRQAFLVEIHAYPGVEYVLKPETGRLYTTDAHGNKKNPSVFYITDNL